MREAEPVMNVSSIVVQTKPEQKEDVLELLENEKEICDVFYHDEKGRIIVTIEGKNIEEEIRKLNILQKIPNVIAADMVYAYSEEELDADRDAFSFSDDSVPPILNNENIKAEDIVYQGNLKKDTFK
jgi:periplasmic nitrate reductase NapD